MGCDVHPIIEVCEERYNAERWTAVAIPDRWRNYELFEALANVRGSDHPPVAPVRDKPDNTCWYTDDVIAGGDHTASWFTLEEAERYDASWFEWDSTKVQWTRWLKVMRFFAELYGVGPEKVRAVFNFDN